MSYLITEDRLARLRRILQGSSDGLLIADGAGRIRFVNEAFSKMFRRPHAHLADLEDLPKLFRDPGAARRMLRAVLEDRQSWRGELVLEAGAGAAVPLAVRADVIARLDGSGALGHIVLVTNLSDRREAAAARTRLQRAILDAQQPLAAAGGAPGEATEFHDLIRAVLSNASLAMTEVADESAGPAVMPALDGLEASTRRAADLTLQMISYASEAPPEE